MAFRYLFLYLEIKGHLRIAIIAEGSFCNILLNIFCANFHISEKTLAKVKKV